MRPNGQVCRNPPPSWRNCSPAALSPRLGKSRELTGTRRRAAALPALPALLQGWYTSQGPQSNHIYTGFTKARTGQWLHRIYSKQEKKKLSLLTSWNTPVRKRTGKVFSQADRDCRTTASTTLLWEESPWVGESCPPQFCVFQHEKQSMPSLPTAREAQGPCICSPPIPKHTATRRSPQSACRDLQVTSPAATWHFCYQRQGSKYLSIIAKVEQQRAGKKYRLPVSSPICASEHLPQTASETRLLLYQAQHCIREVNVY